MNLLVIGNGSTGIDEIGNSYVNQHTGKFLNELNQDINLSFFQYQIKFDLNNDLSNFKLNEKGVKFIPAETLSKLKLVIQAFKLIENYDFVYLFFPGTLSRLFGILCLLKGKRFGIYLRGEKFNEYFLDKSLIKFSKFILTVSPLFISALSHLNKNIEVIKPMIDISVNDLFLGDKVYSKEVIKILSVGRVEKRKGIYEFLEIANLFKNSGKKVFIDFIGGGESIDEINKLIIKHKLSDTFKLHGQISDKSRLSEFYLNSDIFVFLSHDEGFPRVLYEAMAYKIPIFTTFVGGIPGIMEDNYNCFSLPVNEPEKCHIKINTEYKNSENIKSIARNGQETLKKILLKNNSHQSLLQKKLND